MKSKATLFLMEQLVMVLVFALAAALCLGVFSRADQMAEQLAQRDEAVILARNAAELLKATCDPQQVQEQLVSDLFALEILEEDSGIDGLCQVKIVISCENVELFSLRTGWQEVEP